MCVFQRPGTAFFWYDFQFKKHRYQGSTQTAAREQARVIERDLKQRLREEYAGLKPLRDLKTDPNEVPVLPFDVTAAAVLRGRLLDVMNAGPDAIKGEVYFIGDGRAIKIGYAASATARFKTLQTGSPQALKLLAVVPGSMGTERYLHAHFWRSHMRGEWFSLTPGLSAFIKMMRAQPIRRQIARSGISPSAPALIGSGSL